MKSSYGVTKNLTAYKLWFLESSNRQKLKDLIIATETNVNIFDHDNLKGREDKNWEREGKKYEEGRLGTLKFLIANLREEIPSLTEGTWKKFKKY